jgi:hypothetical protein
MTRYLNNGPRKVKSFCEHGTELWSFREEGYVLDLDNGLVSQKELHSPS